MQSQNNQPSNNSINSIAGELINFFGFDSEIEKHLTEKQHLSHTTITEKDKPVIIDALRGYLIRTLGCFTTTGYYRSADLGLWFDYQTLIEEFDDLLLDFRTYLNADKGIDTQGSYTLIRYQDNTHFICTPNEIEVVPVLPVLDIMDAGVVNTIDIMKGHLDEFVQQVDDKSGHLFDVRAVMNELINGSQLEYIINRHIYTE